MECHVLKYRTSTHVLLVFPRTPLLIFSAAYTLTRNIEMSGSAVADIRDTYGAAFIGLFLSTVLYGVTVTQTWIYYWNYLNRDPRLLNGFVALLFILDTLHTILCVYSIYWYLILNFGNVVNLDINLWALNIQTDLGALIGFFVQLFYARRVYIMSRSTVVPMIIAVLGGIYFALGIVFTVKAFTLQRFSRYGSMVWVTCVGLSSAAVADILIALAMCWYLYHKKTGFSKTDSIIMTLISYSINTGLVTSILASGMLVSFVVLRNTLVWEVFFWLMGKCYMNSFLAILNNRDTLRERSSDDNSSNAFHLWSMRPNKTPYKSTTGPTAVAVTVHRTATADFGRSKYDSDNEPELDKSEGMVISSMQNELPESAV